VQVAMATALADDEHVDAQRALYRARRDQLKPAVEAAGLRVDDSEGGLYLWATAGQDAWTTVARLADLGILVAPGTYYGDESSQHVRIALTATDEAIATAVTRLATLSN